LAKDFVLPPEYVMEQGWARRPSIGMMYGAKYNECYKAMLTKLFARGSKKSSSKMGTGMMCERLVQLIPGVFRLPSVLEIQQFITQEKTTAQEESAEADKGQLVVDGSNEELDDHEEVREELPEEVRAAAYNLVEKFNGNIMPRFVYMELVQKFGESCLDKKKLASYTMKLRKDIARARKKILIG
jgi:hypothetical protein